ncbi:MAG: FG-GAP-like repeat-containing protein, partial [Cyanobacteriota bacterium]|nr:FG-GAP-like repeat-containing protein [Cyanobacteriota bacterium]
MNNFLPENDPIPLVDPNSIFPEVDYWPGSTLNSETTDALIQATWGQVRDDLADFLLAPDFATDMQTAFGLEANLDLSRDYIEDILTGERLPDIRVLSAADMNTAVGGFDGLNGTVYLADSLLGGTEDGILRDVLLEEVGHFLDGLLHEEDSPGDEGEIWARLVSGELLRESEVLRLRDEDDLVEIWDGSLLFQVEASQEVDFELAGSLTVGDSPLSVAVEDFNGDGVADLAVANFASEDVSVLLGVGKSYGSFGGATNFAVGGGLSSVVTEDFNGDGILDLVVANFNSDNVSVLLGIGDGSFGGATNFAVGVGPQSVATEDFNGDGILDLAVANFRSNNVSVLSGIGDGSFGGATNFAVGENIWSVAAEDFNRDGILDLAVAKFSGNVSVLIGIGNGSFSQPTNFAVGVASTSVAAEDFNRDGILDLVVVNGNSDNVSVLLGTGFGSFSPATNFAVGVRPQSVATEDFNGDDIPDLAVANDLSGNVSVLPGKGDGSFGQPINFTVAGRPSSVVAEDFNADGIPDLAVANSSSDNVSILINTTPVTITVSPWNVSTLEAGQSYTITWSDNITENVQIDLYKAGSLHTTIDTSTESDGNYDWTVPTTITSGSDYQIKITSVNDTNISDLSDSNFTIQPQDFITVASAGGDILEPGKSYTITWDDNIAENVQLDLYKAGTFNRTIESSTESDGNYIWTVPTSITSGGDYQVKVTSVNDVNVSDLSDINFTIQPQKFITVASAGGDILEPGKSYTITWDDNIAENVQLDLYKAGTFNRTIE